MARTLTIRDLAMLVEGFVDGLSVNPHNCWELHDEIEGVYEYIQGKTTDKQQMKDVMREYLQVHDDIPDKYFVKFCDHCGPCIRKKKKDHFLRCSKCKIDICPDCHYDFGGLCENCGK